MSDDKKQTPEHPESLNNPGKKKKPREKEELPLQEYRLVPVEEWDGSESGENEIDLVELAKHIWENRSTIYKFVALGIVLGLAVALLSPKEYQSSATLMPEIQSEQSVGGLSSALQQFGGVLGISGAAALEGGGGGSISVLLYPNIIESLTFQKSIMDQEIYFAEYDTTTTVYTFLADIYTPSVFAFIQKYTLGLPGIMIKLIKGEQEVVFDPSLDEDIVNLSKNQMEIIEDLRSRVNSTVNKENGIVSVSVTMPEPKVAAKLTKFAVDELTKYVTAYRIEKASQDLEFIEEQMMEAKSRFEEAQEALASFRDQNQGQLTNRAQTEQERLNSVRALTENVYTMLAQQYEEAKIRVQEETPVFKVLQPVQVPVEDTTSGALILFAFVALSVFAALGIILFNFIRTQKKQNAV